MDYKKMHLISLLSEYGRLFHLNRYNLEKLTPEIVKNYDKVYTELKRRLTDYKIKYADNHEKLERRLSDKESKEIDYKKYMDRLDNEFNVWFRDSLFSGESKSIGLLRHGFNAGYTTVLERTLNDIVDQNATTKETSEMMRLRKALLELIQTSHKLWDWIEENVAPNIPVDIYVEYEAVVTEAEIALHKYAEWQDIE